ncbi:MAG: hypothetical protein KAX49_12990, partial [Halanaerobiales bacterium]|nr:hypothetical protein [Halanaerobiales bacterium]
VISGKSVLAIKILREIIKQTKSKSKIHFLPEEVAQPQQVKSIGELEEFCTVLRMPNIFEKRLREVLK